MRRHQFPARETQFNDIAIGFNVQSLGGKSNHQSKAQFGVGLQANGTREVNPV